MAGLNQRDIRILEDYAKNGNRMLYWNYLAHQPGSDGYGLLALRVVRNDNMPGAIANAFAQAHARTHIHRTLSEREWEGFGQSLIHKDLARRKYYLEEEYQPDKALNLPVKDVQGACLEFCVRGIA